MTRALRFVADLANAVQQMFGKLGKFLVLVFELQLIAGEVPDVEHPIWVCSNLDTAVSVSANHGGIGRGCWWRSIEVASRIRR